MKDGIRLDTLLVERGLAASRERARALILAGSVRVNGQPAPKAGTTVARDSEVTVAAPDHRRLVRVVEAVVCRRDEEMAALEKAH